MGLEKLAKLSHSQLHLHRVGCQVDGDSLAGDRIRYSDRAGGFAVSAVDDLHLGRRCVDQLDRILQAEVVADILHGPVHHLCRLIQRGDLFVQRINPGVDLAEYLDGCGKLLLQALVLANKLPRSHPTLAADLCTERSDLGLGNALLFLNLPDVFDQLSDLDALERNNTGSLDPGEQEVTSDVAHDLRLGGVRQTIGDPRQHVCLSGDGGRHLVGDVRQGRTHRASDVVLPLRDGP